MFGFIKSILAPAAAPAAPAAAPAPAPATKPAVDAVALFVRHWMSHGAGGVEMGYRLAEAIAAKDGRSRRELEMEDLRETPPTHLMWEASYEMTRFISLEYQGVLTPERYERELDKLWELIRDLS